MLSHFLKQKTARILRAVLRYRFLIVSERLRKFYAHHEKHRHHHAHAHHHIHMQFQIKKEILHVKNPLCRLIVLQNISFIINICL